MTGAGVGADWPWQADRLRAITRSGRKVWTNMASPAAHFTSMARVQMVSEGARIVGRPAVPKVQAPIHDCPKQPFISGLSLPSDSRTLTMPRRAGAAWPASQDLARIPKGAMAWITLRPVPFLPKVLASDLRYSYLTSAEIGAPPWQNTINRKHPSSEGEIRQEPNRC